MAVPFLTPPQVEKQQSESEGYQQGPQPEINNPNANTQDALGNTVTQTPVAPPYYPGATETPNLQLSLTNMPVNIAENFVIIDSLPTSVPLIVNATQLANVNTPQSLSLIAPAAPTGVFYEVPIYLNSRGDGAVGSSATSTLTWTGLSGAVHTAVLIVAGDVASAAQLETFPILVLGGSPISVVTTFATTPFHYDIAVRILALAT